MKKLVAELGKTTKEVAAELLEDGRWRVVIDGVERVVDAKRLEGGGWSLIVDGRVWMVDVEPGKDGAWQVDVAGIGSSVKLVDPRLKRLAEAAQRPKAAGGPEDVRAPMPGKVVKVLAKPGDRVSAGQGLVVVEAMKMENELRAPREALVKVVHVKEGQAVEAQEPLVTIE